MSDDYIESTAIDVMHCVYEGVVMKMMLLWFDSEFKNFAFSKFEDGAFVSELLSHITPPSYIKRMPRSVTEHLSLWKAPEFKNWLFYYSAGILSSVLSPELHNHYLLLVHATYLLNQPSVSEAMIDEAYQCLHEFLYKFEDLYHVKFATINFHMLLHLPDQVRKFGPLWTTSCMAMEDLNGQFKRMVHGTVHVAKQIVPRLGQTMHLPLMLDKMLPHDPVRIFCENMQRRKNLKILERIDDRMSCVGAYYKPRNVPPIIAEALAYSNIVGNVTMFYRLKIGKLLLTSESYGRHVQTNSTAVKFRAGNETEYGVIHSYTKITDCNCNMIGRCEGLFFCILSKLEVEAPFHIVYPAVTLSYVMKSLVDKGT